MAEARAAVARVFSWYPEAALDEGCRALASSLRTELEYALHVRPEPAVRPPSMPEPLASARATPVTPEGARALPDRASAPPSHPPVVEGRLPAAPPAESCSTSTRTATGSAPAPSPEGAALPFPTRLPEPAPLHGVAPIGRAGSAPSDRAALQPVEASKRADAKQGNAVTAASSRATPRRDREVTVSEVVDRVFATEVLTRWPATAPSTVVRAGAPTEPLACPDAAASVSAATPPTAAPTSSNRAPVVPAPNCASGSPPRSDTRE